MRIDLLRLLDSTLKTNALNEDPIFQYTSLASEKTNIWPRKFFFDMQPPIC
jgi:hypothetical protein